jgi:hypothetical protein
MRLKRGREEADEYLASNKKPKLSTDFISKIENPEKTRELMHSRHGMKSPRISCYTLTEQERINRENYAICKHLSRDEALELVNEKPFALKYLSDEYRNDKTVVRIATERSNSSFEYASDSLCNDKVFVHSLLKSNCWILKYVSSELRTDKETVLLAVQKHGYSITHASTELKSDMKFALEVIKHIGNLECVPKKWFDNRDVVLGMLSQSVSCIHKVSHELKNDKSFLIKAIKAMKKGECFLELFYKWNGLDIKWKRDKDILCEVYLREGGLEKMRPYLDSAFIQEHRLWFLEFELEKTRRGMIKKGHALRYCNVLVRCYN